MDIGTLGAFGGAEAYAGAVSSGRNGFFRFFALPEQEVSYDAELGENWTRKTMENQVLSELQRQEANVDGVHIGWNEESGLPEKMEISGKNLPESLKEDAAKEYGLETEAIALVP